jgi:hypothetical protein
VPEVPGLAAAQPMTRIDALDLDHLPEHLTLKVYPGAPHGLCSTHKEQVNADLLAFFKA